MAIETHLQNHHAAMSKVQHTCGMLKALLMLLAMGARALGLLEIHFSVVHKARGLDH